MSVRVTILAFLFGAMALSGVLLGGLVLGGASAAERIGPSAAPASAPNDFPVASDVRLGGDETQTRLIVDLSHKVDIRAFTLANPYRVVLDMPQVTFQFPPKAGEVGRGLIKAFRFGLVMQGGSRMVIDLVRPAQVDMAFVLGAANDQPARLVLHLTATDREAFMRNVALESRAPEGSKPQTPPETKVNGDSRPLVVIDPGHGGIDNGTRAASGEMEKSIVLEFSQLLRDKIEKAGKYRVLMTRTDDTFVALVDLARRETKTFSVQFAQTVVGTLKNATRLHQHPLKSARFVVLKAPDVPSVLVELGYVSNRADLKSLISTEWRDRTADSIVRAIDAFFGTRLAGGGQN